MENTASGGVGDLPGDWGDRSVPADDRGRSAPCGGSFGAAGSFETISEALEQFTFSRLAAIRGKNGEVDPEKKALVSDCRSRVKKAVEKLKESICLHTPEQMLADMEAGKERILELLELAQEFGRRFRAKKKEKNVVDFHDLEHFALEILTEPEAECSEAEETSSAEETDQMQGKNAWTVRVPGTVADEIAVQYDEILVDEYQDTNEAQDMIFRAVSPNGGIQSLYGGETSSRAFMVSVRRCRRSFCAAAPPSRFMTGRRMHIRPAWCLTATSAARRE